MLSETYLGKCNYLKGITIKKYSDNKIEL